MTTFKCLPVEYGIDVSLNSRNFFTFKTLTHNLIDLGDGNVRISRKLDGLIEIVSTPIASFVDLNGTPVANTFGELNTYFNTTSGAVKAGEGVVVNGSTVSVAPGGPSTLGGFKVGTGLQVDGSGRLSASASSEVTKVLSTEQEMLDLVAEPLRPYRVIRLDTNRLYYLNAGDSPAVLANWFTGPSLETTALSFKGRTGAIDPEFGDYDLDLVPLVDKTTAASHKFVIDDNKLYVENIATSARTAIGSGSDLTALQTQVVNLDTVVNSQSNGLVVKVDQLRQDTDNLINTVSNQTDGLSARVFAAEVKAAEHDVILDEIIVKNSAQDVQIAAKADLVSGKVPFSQLPDFPVGRKVTVNDASARLALAVHPDLTIAYQADTGEAWALNAGADPSVQSNWTQLGNAQALGVQSFKGRTGNIVPQNGDYTTDQLTETDNRFFLTREEVEMFYAKETPAGAQAKADAARTAAVASAKSYADITFIPVTQRNVANGLAPLDANSKVPITNLLTNVSGGVPLLNANTKIPAQYIETGTASGVAPLGTASKVPMSYILTNTAGGVPLLDGNTRIPASQIPRRSWYNVKGQRTVGGYITHNAGAGLEMTVYVRCAQSNSISRELRAFVRQNSGASDFVFQSDAIEIAGNRWLHLYFHVPFGWQYLLSTNGGTTTANIETWYEMY